MRHRIYHGLFGILWVCPFAIVLLYRAFFSQCWQFPSAMPHFPHALTPSHNTVTLNTFTIYHIPSMNTGRFAKESVRQPLYASYFTYTFSILKYM